MDTKQANEIWSEVMSMMRASGGGKGSILRPTQIMYRKAVAAGHTNLDFEAWNKDLRATVGLNTHPPKHVGPKPNSIVGRYRDLAAAKKHIPTDELLAEVWGVKRQTIRSSRAQLRREGFDFIEIEGGFRVIHPPAPIAAPPPPAPDPVPASVPVAAEPVRPAVRAVPLQVRLVDLMQVLNVIHDELCAHSRQNDRIIEQNDAMLALWGAPLNHDAG